MYTRKCFLVKFLPGIVCPHIKQSSFDVSKVEQMRLNQRWGQDAQVLTGLWAKAVSASHQGYFPIWHLSLISSLKVQVRTKQNTNKQTNNNNNSNNNSNNKEQETAEAKDLRLRTE